MKYKLIALAAVFFSIVFSLLLLIPKERENQRFHQHRAAVPRSCMHGAEAFCSHLPVVAIDTKGQEIQIEPVEQAAEPHMESPFILGEITVYDSPNGANHLSDTPTLQSGARMKYRGNSSLYFDKKSYKLDLVREDGTEVKDQTFLGMPAHDQWVLNGPFLDKTMMRNYMCMNIAGEIMEDAPEVRFCELFENGEYRGIYVAMENPARDENRMDIATHKPGDPYTGYLLREDRDIGQAPKINNFLYYAMRMPRNTAVEILYPAWDDLTPELVRYIENDFSAFEKTLYSFDYNTSDFGYEHAIDVDSFVDYFVINEFFSNYDAGLFSTYFYKDVRGKLHIGPVWDFNNCCDNFIEEATPTTGFEMIYRPRYFMLMKDERFTERVINRYRQLRETVLSESYLMKYVDETQAFLGSALERNFKVWGYSFDPSKVPNTGRLQPVERNLTSYDSAIRQYKSFLQARGVWLDDNIELLRQYSHASKTKKFNH